MLFYLYSVSSSEQHFKLYFTESAYLSYGDCHAPAPPGAAHQVLGARLGGRKLLPQTECLRVTGEQTGFSMEI